MTDTGLTAEHVRVVKEAGDTLELLSKALKREKQKSAKLGAALKSLANTCELYEHYGEIKYSDIAPNLRQAFVVLAEVEK